MLKPEVAREELNKLEKKDWAAARVAAADGLPGGLMRDSARSIFGADKNSHPDTHDDEVRRWELSTKPSKKWMSRRAASSLKPAPLGWAGRWPAPGICWAGRLINPATCANPFARRGTRKR